MSEQSGAEAKQQYIAAMGEPLGTQYAELWQEVAQRRKRGCGYSAPSRVIRLASTFACPMARTLRLASSRAQHQLPVFFGSPCPVSFG